MSIKKTSLAYLTYKNNSMMKKNYILLLITMLCFSNIQAQKDLNKERQFYKPNITEEDYLKDINKVNLYPKGRNILFSKKANKKTKKNTAKFEFVNGINIAWFKFASDVGVNRWAKGPSWKAGQKPIVVQFDKFEKVFKQVANAGGKVVRWWLHTDGTATPIYGKNGIITPTPKFVHKDIIKILDIAKKNKIKVQICLWSFDMALRKKAGEKRVGTNNTKLVNVEANEKLLKYPKYMNAYFNNALIPMVKAVGNHPGLYAWEIFNEPEGMTWITNWDKNNRNFNYAFKLTIKEVQIFVNRAAAAIRSANPHVKITNGAWGFKSSVNDPANGFKNLYTNKELIKAGGKPLGYLDFYNIHYYDWAGTTGSPFINNSNKYRMDKPTVIAEYYPNNNNNNIKRNLLAKTLKNKGWHGSLSWSHSDAMSRSKQDGLRKKAYTNKAKKDKRKESDFTYTFNDMLNIIRELKKKTSRKTLRKDVNQTQINTDIRIRRIQDLVIVENIPNGVKNVVIYNMSGIIIKNQEVEAGSSTIDLSSFTEGIYLISFQHNNELFVKKIIK